MSFMPIMGPDWIQYIKSRGHLYLPYSESQSKLVDILVNRLEEISMTVLIQLTRDTVMNGDDGVSNFTVP